MLRTVQANVILVDWGVLSRSANILAFFGLDYGFARLGSRVVGVAVGQMLKALLKEQFITAPCYLHLVGFGLGAHVMGIAGEFINRTVKYPVGRITG